MTSRWKERREFGNPILIRPFARLCLAMNPWVARLLLVPICLYFYLVKTQERRASRAFLERALDRPVHAGDVWRHFRTFGQVVLDRVFILGRAECGMKLVPENSGALAGALDEGNGCLLLGSHLGSFEASRTIKRSRPDVPLRLVMDRQQSPAATAFLETLSPELAREVLDVGSEPRIALTLLSTLQDGALVALLSDRPQKGEQTVTVDFMGRPARFPATPHVLAMVTQAPVVLFWGLYVSPGRYRIVFERLPTPPRAARGERERAVRDSVQRFARRLEHHARQAPYNWFNFYDFWADAE